MKALKIFAVAALAIILAVPCRANVSSVAAPATQTTSASLTKNNGAAAGNAAKSAATEALAKIASSQTASNAKEVATAASTLSTLFKTLKK